MFVLIWLIHCQIFNVHNAQSTEIYLVTFPIMDGEGVTLWYHQDILSTITCSTHGYHHHPGCEAGEESRFLPFHLHFLPFPNRTIRGLEPQAALSITNASWLTLLAMVGILQVSARRPSRKIHNRTSKLFSSSPRVCKVNGSRLQINVTLKSKIMLNRWGFMDTKNNWKIQVADVLIRRNEIVWKIE